MPLETLTIGPSSACDETESTARATGSDDGPLDGKPPVERRPQAVRAVGLPADRWTPG